MAAIDRRLLVLVASLVAVSARADDRAAAGVWVHTDDDGLTVIHPIATARAQVAEETHALAQYDADVVSAATVDVRTSASPRGFSEARHGLAAGVDHDLTRTLNVAIAGAFGWTPDHRSYAGSIRGAIEDDARVNRVTASVGVAREIVGRAGDLAPVGSVWTIGATVGWATLLSSEGALDLAVAAERQEGYLESPYRFVPVTDAVGQAVVRLPERVPDLRWRGAARARVRIGLAANVFGTAWYRLHLDDWGIAGHTVELSLAVEPEDCWLVTVHGRFYGQRGASFYRGRYAALPDVPALRTLDRELAPAFYLAAGVRAEHEVGDFLSFVWRLSVRAEVVRHRYFDTPALPDRLALTAGGGLVGER